MNNFASTTLHLCRRGISRAVTLRRNLAMFVITLWSLCPLTPLLAQIDDSDGNAEQTRSRSQRRTLASPPQAKENSANVPERGGRERDALKPVSPDPKASEPNVIEPSAIELDAKPVRYEFVRGEIIVRFRPDTAPAKHVGEINLLAATNNRVIALRFEDASGLEVLDGLRVARVAPADTEAAITILENRPDVLYAEPNFVRRKLRVPNDPSFAQQWSLLPPGQPGTTNAGGVAAETAWDVTTGSSDVVIGVVDEGI